MNNETYKYCAVNMCKNTSLKTPSKMFIRVPKQPLRNLWLSAASTPSETNSAMYFCEDHFDLPNDMENYLQFYMMDSVSAVRMKPGCVPSKFDCQPDRLLDRISKDPVGETSSGDSVLNEEEMLEPAFDLQCEEEELSDSVSPQPKLTCFSPLCKNDSHLNPKKIFIKVPKQRARRWEWFQAANGPQETFGNRNVDLYCCEDHFEKSVPVNWYRLKDEYRPKKGVTPTLFPSSGEMLRSGSIENCKVESHSDNTNEMSTKKTMEKDDHPLTESDRKNGSSTAAESDDNLIVNIKMEVDSETDEPLAHAQIEYSPPHDGLVMDINNAEFSIKAEIMSDADGSDVEWPAKRRKDIDPNVKQKAVAVAENVVNNALPKKPEKSNSSHKTKTQVVGRILDYSPVNKKYTTLKVPSRVYASSFVDLFPKPCGTSNTSTNSTGNSTNVPKNTASTSKNTIPNGKRKLILGGKKNSTVLKKASSCDNSIATNENRDSFIQYLVSLMEHCDDDKKSEFEEFALRWFIDMGIVARKRPKK